MIIRVDDSFRPHMNGLAEVEVDCTTVAEGIHSWLNRFPQLQVRLLDNEGEVAKRSYFVLDGEALADPAAGNREASGETVLELRGDLPEGCEVGFWTVVGFIVGFLITEGIKYATGNTSLFDLIDMEEPDISNFSLSGSPTYSFTGIRNTTASGTPLSLVYGTHRVGGQVLNVYTQTTIGINTSSETLFAQVGVCEGEIDSISTIEVNKLPSNFYNAIEYDVSNLGTATQEIMPQFSRVESTTTVSKKIFNLMDSAQQRIDFTDNIWNYHFTAVSGEPSPVYGVLEETADGKSYVPVKGCFKIPRVWPTTASS